MNNLDVLRKEYVTQNNRMTAYPIYVTVQERFCVGVMDESSGVNCPYGDGEMKAEYVINYDSDPDSFSSFAEAKQSLKEQYPDSKDAGILAESIEDIKEVQVGYIWHPVEFFLTVKGAEEYMRCNAHNHGTLRTYIHHFERRNFEMRMLLEEIGFRIMILQR